MLPSAVYIKDSFFSFYCLNSESVAKKKIDEDHLITQNTKVMPYLI